LNQNFQWQKTAVATSQLFKEVLIPVMIEMALWRLWRISSFPELGELDDINLVCCVRVAYPAQSSGCVHFTWDGKVLV
jgi:hypothetical protein